MPFSFSPTWVLTVWMTHTVQCNKWGNMGFRRISIPRLFLCIMHFSISSSSSSIHALSCSLQCYDGCTFINSQFHWICILYCHNTMLLYFSFAWYIHLMLLISIIYNHCLGKDNMTQFVYFAITNLLGMPLSLIRYM